jgi:hypothetical protein
MVKAEAEAIEIDFGDSTTTPKEKELEDANRDVEVAKKTYERRKYIDHLKTMPVNPNGAPRPPRDPNFFRDDATLPDLRTLDRELRDRKEDAAKRASEKTKLYSAVAKVVTTIMNTVDTKHGERVAAAIAKPELKGKRVAQLKAAIAVVVANLHTDPFNAMQKFRKRVTDLDQESPENAQEVLDIIHLIETRKSEAAAFALTFSVDDLLTGSDIVSTIKGVVSHLSSVELAGAEEIIRKADHKTDWVVWVAAVSRELNSKISSESIPKKRKAKPSVKEQVENADELKAFMASSKKQLKEIQEGFEAFKSKNSEYAFQAAGANRFGNFTGNDGICHAWKSEAGCQRGVYCRFQHPNGKDKERSSDRRDKDKSEYKKTTSSQRSTRSPSPVSRPNTPGRRLEYGDSRSRSSSPAGSRSASPVKGRGA